MSSMRNVTLCLGSGLWVPCLVPIFARVFIQLLYLDHGKGCLTCQELLMLRTVTVNTFDLDS